MHSYHNLLKKSGYKTLSLIKLKIANNPLHKKNKPIIKDSKLIEIDDNLYANYNRISRNNDV